VNAGAGCPIYFGFFEFTDRSTREKNMHTRIDVAQDSGRMPGIVFTGCGLTPAAPARAESRSAASAKARAKPASRRRIVKVGGKRVKTIDVHAHCVIPEAMALLGLNLADQRGPGIAEVGERRIREMDEQGIDMEALSINPQWYKAERDLVTKVIRIQNERLAEFCATYPDRFVAFASVALQYPDLAIQQLVDGVKRLGLRGAAVGASVAGREFSDAMFHPFWAKAEELGILIFIHPQSTPDLAPRLRGNGWLANTIGNPLDTTIALSHLIFEGTLDRFPRLKICSAHGGGYLPSYAPRSDNCLRVAPDMDTGVRLKKKPTEYLRDLYYDTLVFTSEALRHLAAEVGSNRLVIGTDHPIPWQSKSVDHILKAPGFTDKERRMMLGETAAKLLGIKP
jgi:aminocarboxymuconate-semialdehyde decarboxylase